jgi:signal transduction histidine kinase
MPVVMPMLNSSQAVRLELRPHIAGYSKCRQHSLTSPLRLEQVFVNLLSNAAKYTPNGGNIEVRASAGHDEVWVRVSDTGIGIPTDTLPHVFELFTRGETASAKAKEGLGIGLSLVKEFVNLHGGSTQVRSDGPGKGSEFTVRLPRSGTQAADQSAAITSRAEARHSHKSQLQNRDTSSATSR